MKTVYRPVPELFWKNFRQKVDGDAVKQLQVQCLSLSWELYEWSMKMSATSPYAKGAIWRCDLVKQEGRKLRRKTLTVSPIEKVIWRFEDGNFVSVKKAWNCLLLTNLSLRRDYIEDEQFGLVLQGIPNYSIEITFPLNRLPQITCT